MGQHNHEILVDDLGIDEATYTALENARVIGDRPRASEPERRRPWP